MIRVCGDRLLLRPDQLKKKHKVEGTDIELDLNWGNKEKQLEAATTEGEVVQLGPQAYEGETPWCKVGERVLWGKYAGYWVTDPDTKENLIILDPHDVLCVITTTGDAK